MQVDEATLSDDVWSWMPPIERLHTWLWISEEKRDEIAEFAVRVLHEAADLLWYGAQDNFVSPHLLGSYPVLPPPPPP